MHPHHTHAAILSVGDELAIGQSLNTNSAWLAARLTSLGINVHTHLTIPDDLALHARALTHLAQSHPLIISTGGLGPTLDDLTRHALALALLPPHTAPPEDPSSLFITDQDALASINALLLSRGRTPTPAHHAQALRPHAASCLPNTVGTAPGLHARLSHPPAVNADVFCLPGPPSEMKPMFDTHVAPRLRPPPDRCILTHLIHTTGIAESDAASRLAELMQRDRNPLVGVTISAGVVSARIRYAGPDTPDARALFNKTIADARARLAPFVFAEGETSIEAAALATLLARNRSLVTIESCTGGLLAQRLTAIPGASASFLGGYVTYSNPLKTHAVDVPADLINTHGAVSVPVAAAMALGGLRHAHAHHALSITGIAGPDGGTPHKPVGTVCIAHAHRDTLTPDAPVTTDARTFLFTGSRDDIRARAASTALAMLILSHTLSPNPVPPLLWQRAAEP